MPFEKETDLPKNFAPVTRINVLDHSDLSLQTQINQHCITNGQPLVIGNFDKKFPWFSNVFNLNKLMEYQGDSEIVCNLPDTAPKFILGDFLKTLLNKFNMPIIGSINTQVEDATNLQIQANSQPEVTSHQANQLQDQATLQLDLLVNNPQDHSVNAADHDLFNNFRDSLQQMNRQQDSTSPTTNTQPQDIIYNDNSLAGTELIQDTTQQEQLPNNNDNNVNSDNSDDTYSDVDIEYSSSEEENDNDSYIDVENDDSYGQEHNFSFLSDGDDILSDAETWLDAEDFSEFGGAIEVSTVATYDETESDPVATNEPMLVETQHLAVVSELKLEVLPAIIAQEASMPLVVTELKQEGLPVTNDLDLTKEQPPDANSSKYQALDFSEIDRIYAKDIECPNAYRQAMNNLIPEYMLPHGDNDLFSLMEERLQAKNLMCYVGQDDTGTPMHRDLCGTMGHNIMTTGSPGAHAEWYIITNQDRDKLLKIKHGDEEASNSNNGDTAESSSTPTTLASTPSTASSMVKKKKSFHMETDREWLKQEVVENNNLGLQVQVIVQRPGDLVIVPSRSYHQVRNVGASAKIAWNRITPQTLEYALEDQIPLYQIICRPEVYKCKAIIRFTLQNWLNSIRRLNPKDTEEINKIPAMKYGRGKFIQDATKLSDLYLNKVLLNEMLDKTNERGITVDQDDYNCSVTCDFCHGDIFYRFYHCAFCTIPNPEDPQETSGYDLCMNCFASGRSCKHGKRMRMHQSSTPLTASPVVSGASEEDEDGQEVDSLIDIYTKFIFHVNRVFDDQVLVDNSHILYEHFKKDVNLATTCRRIEKKSNDTSFVIPDEILDEDIDLVYWANPNFDQRNYGSSFDLMHQKSNKHDQQQKRKRNYDDEEEGRRTRQRKMLEDATNNNQQQQQQPSTATASSSPVSPSSPSKRKQKRKEQDISDDAAAAFTKKLKTKK